MAGPVEMNDADRPFSFDMRKLRNPEHNFHALRSIFIQFKYSFAHVSDFASQSVQQETSLKNSVKLALDCFCFARHIAGKSIRVGGTPLIRENGNYVKPFLLPKDLQENDLVIATDSAGFSLSLICFLESAFQAGKTESFQSIVDGSWMDVNKLAENRISIEFKHGGFDSLPSELRYLWQGEEKAKFTFQLSTPES